MINIVIGLGFGDEGKGAVTNYLSKINNTKLVARFNGGHQAGHTVYNHDNSINHVFHSFGSGSFYEIPTYWSKYCTFYPIGFINEYYALKNNNKCNPKIFVDMLSPVTTTYDVHMNRRRASINEHGSVGVGIGTTFERHDTPNKLYFKDLLYGDEILNYKLKNIRDYYEINFSSKTFTHAANSFNVAVSELRKLLEDNVVHICSERTLVDYSNDENLIFEGAQGILLDQNHGFFPNVTRSNCTSQNVFEIMHRNDELYKHELCINYVTRAYLTRHGNGPLIGEGKEKLNITYKNSESNKDGEFQGKFRYAPFNIDLFKYSIATDFNYHLYDYKKRLFVTCTDHLINENYVIMKNSMIIEMNQNEFIKTIASYDIFDEIYTSDNPYSDFKLIYDKNR